MSREVRCGRCGRLLVVADGAGKKVRCPCCGTRIKVPGVLPAPPQPGLAGQESALAAAGEAQLPADAQEYRQEVIARAVPWIVSVMLHASIALILAFVVMLTVAEGPTPHDMVLGVYDIPGPRFAATEEQDGERLRQPKPVKELGTSDAKGTEVTRPDDSKSKIPSGLLLPDKDGRKGRPPAPPGPPEGIFNPVPPGVEPAKYIVFVIDRSGSMVDTFERVRVEILRTVGPMREDQYFHVLLFSDGPPIENRPRRLVPAVEKRKLDLVGFLKPIRASGRTDPLPALKRAFNVLAGTKGKGNKLIHLLTDGVFPDNDKVLALIRRSTAGTGIRINTYLCGYRPPAADMVMKKIALESQGVYNYIPLTE